MDFQPVLRTLAQKYSETIRLIDCQAAQGGCISDSYILTTNVAKVFVKVAALSSGEKSNKGILSAERDGLNALSQVGVLKVPTVLGLVEEKCHDFLILEYLDLTSLTASQQREFGQALAKHHQASIGKRMVKQSNGFGWHQDNFIGATPQINTWNASWPKFFAKNRLEVQLELLEKRGVASSLKTQVLEVIQNIDFFFADHQPQPVLVHGDLWGGNASGSNLGPVCYDPAVYFGDREVDLAMTELFGGFSTDFYKGYEAVWPLDKGYKERISLYNLYHILNHVNLFGSSYEAQAKQLAQLCLQRIK